jgi:hypothetical protein
MAESDRGTLWRTLLPAGLGIFGAVLGSLTTGYFQMRSQKQAYDLAAMQETSRGARETGADIPKLAADYLNRLGYFAAVDPALIQKDKTAREAIVKEYLDLQKVGFELSLRVSLPATKAVLEGMTYAGQVTDAARNPEKAASVKADAKAIGSAYMALYVETARYRLRGTPQATEDELMTTLVQLLTTAPQSVKK